MALLQGLGFTVEPAAFHEATGRRCHRVWIEADAAAWAKAARAAQLSSRSSRRLAAGLRSSGSAESRSAALAQQVPARSSRRDRRAPSRVETRPG
jgi:hypothetical protein